MLVFLADRLILSLYLSPQDLWLHKKTVSGFVYLPMYLFTCLIGWLVFETCFVVQADLEFRGSSCLCLLSVGITDMHHHSQLQFLNLNGLKFKI